jgi:hypothetical protein
MNIAGIKEFQALPSKLDAEAAEIWMCQLI